MSYQALYRKYRPKDLTEVYGQHVVVNILKNAVKNKKFGHAYLFTGSRGCGKTSVAKILARMVNCENVEDGKLCGKCASCMASSDNNCVDILEIDAASNNGVDEIRELKSKVNLIPSVLKYKVYIIDEVHMLSIGAFNALLKTLEEPPEHVIFILATTELNKVPITIVSRCQTIEFKKINNKDMFDRLKEIANLEKINITDDAIAEIVNVSDGGLRDAVGMLDMSTSYSTDQITEDDIYAINGNVSNNEIEYLVDLIIKKQLSTIINLINDYYNTGKDLVKIFEKVIFVMTNKMIKNNDSNICTIIKILTETVEKMKNSSIGKIYLEVALFELFTETVDKVNNIVVEEKVVNVTPISTETVERKIELKVEEKPKEEIPIKTSTKVVTNDLKKIRINNTFVEADKKVLTEVKNKWDKLNDYTFDKDKGAIVCELLDATPTAAGANYLILTYNYDSFVEKGNMYIEKYEKVLNELLDLTNKLVFLTNDEWKKIKNEYIENIKNNVKYSYIEETISVPENSEESSMPELNRQSEIVEKANQLFDMSKIEIKGE